MIRYIDPDCLADLEKILTAVTLTRSLVDECWMLKPGAG